MEISVKGIGSKTYAPNQIVFSLNFYVSKNTYQEALENGSKSVDIFINNILIPYGFTKQELKTKSFIVREDTSYDNITREYKLKGYSYNQMATLKFDFDKEKMTKMILELSKMENAPQYRINFSLKNDESYRKEILSLAYNDAKEQAYAIANAAELTLKECVKVDFNPFTKYKSQTYLDNDYVKQEYSSSASPNKTIANTFNPEDLEVRETLYCLWIAQ